MAIDPHHALSQARRQLADLARHLRAADVAAAALSATQIPHRRSAGNNAELAAELLELRAVIAQDISGIRWPLQTVLQTIESIVPSSFLNNP